MTSTLKTKMTVHTSTFHEVYDTGMDASITVCDYEIPGVIQVKIAAECEGAFGKADFTMNPDLAEQVANAILERVSAIRNEQLH